MSETQAPHRIGFVIVGCGQMGTAAIKAIHFLDEECRALRGHIAPDILALIDPNPAKRELAKHLCVTLFGGELALLVADRGHSDFPLATYEILRPTLLREGFPIVVYDATPPQFHYSHLNYVYRNHLLRKHVIYVGEKPLVVDRQNLNSVSSFEIPFYCDLIEGANPAFRAVAEYINTQGVNVESMMFWRVSSMGIEKYLETNPDRDIRGGALLDKSPHDFSLAVGLLGVDNIKQVKVRACQVLLLVPTAASRQNNNAEVLSISELRNLSRFDFANEKIALEDRFPSDGVMKVSTNWELINHRSVRSDFLFSWLGLTGCEWEGQLHSKLAGLGYGQNDYVLQHPNHGFSQEVRLCIIEAADRTIVCNFLQKTDINNLLVRFVHVHFHVGTRREIIYTSKPGNHQQLSCVFADIIDHHIVDLNGLRPFERDPPMSRFFDKTSALRTHEILLDVQEAAMANIEIQAKPLMAWFQEASRFLNKKTSISD